MFKRQLTDFGMSMRAAHNTWPGIIIVAMAMMAMPVQSAPGSAKLKEVADAIATEMGSLISPVIDQLANLDDEKLVNIFSLDDVVMQAEADTLLGNFPNGLKLRLFKPGNYELDREAKPPLGFASVAMLRSMEKSGNDMAVELHLANSPDKHIVIVRKLADAEGNLVGLVHLSLNPASLLKILEQHDSTDTYVELGQPLGDKILALATRGSNSLRVGKPVSGKVPGTKWQVDVWSGEVVPDGEAADASTSASPGKAKGFINITMLAVILAVFLVIAGGLIFVIKRKKGEAIATESEDVVYGGAVLAIMEGAHPGVEKLVPNLPGLGQSKAIKPISHGLIADDITVIEKPPATPVAKKATPTRQQQADKAPADSKPAGKLADAAPPEPAVTEMPGAKSPEQAGAAPQDMGMEFELPGAAAAPAADKPAAEETPPVASEQDLVMEFDMPGADTPEAKTPAPEDTPASEAPGEQDMSLDFDMPGTGAPVAKDAPATDQPDAQDMSLDFDIPDAGSAQTEKTATEEASAVASEQDLVMEFDMPGAGASPKQEEPPDQAPAAPGDTGLELDMAGTEAPAATEKPAVEASPESENEPDPIIEFEEPAVVDTDAPPDLSMEFELPGADEATDTEESSAANDGAAPDQGMEFELPGTTPEKKSPEKKTVKSGETAKQKTVTITGKAELSPLIFRAYDIRGIVGKTLTAAVVQQIGQAIGSEAEVRGQKKIAVGRDGRTSSLELAEALTGGLRAAGRDVIDIGMVPTPVLYFATHHLGTGSGVMVTGSHNGPAYNGLKIMLAGETLATDAIQALYQRVRDNDLVSGKGGFRTEKVIDDYISRISEDIPGTLGGALKIVIDCGNGVAGLLAPALFRTLGHEIIELYCDVDGKFPNHHPDPSQTENLEDLISRVKEEQADLGLAFDGDGDRLGVVDGEGNIIWPDRQMMVFARDVVSRNLGASIIFDVKCSHHLKAVIEENGGKPLMWKTGHSLIKAKMKEVDAPLAGEMSGHIFFKERWYGFDDAMYAGARLVEILTGSNKKPAEVFSEFPGDVTTPEIRVSLKEKHHAKFMRMLRKKIKFEDGELIDIDGIRVDFPYGWGLIRPSNTSPFLIVRFEAEDEEKLNMIQTKFHDVIKSVAPDLKLPF